MPPARCKSKFPSQSMTILKCFAKQREKLQLKVENPSPVPGENGDYKQDADFQTSDIIVLHHQTPELDKKRMTVSALQRKDRSIRGNYSYEPADASVSNRADVAAEDGKARVTPNTCQPINKVTKVSIKSTRRNLTPSFNECAQSLHSKSAAIKLSGNKNRAVENKPMTKLHLKVNEPNRLTDWCGGDDSDDDFMPSNFKSKSTSTTSKTSNEVSVRCSYSLREQRNAASASKPLHSEKTLQQLPKEGSDLHEENGNKRNLITTKSSFGPKKLKLMEQEESANSRISPPNKFGNCVPSKSSKPDNMGTPSECLRYEKGLSPASSPKKYQNIASPQMHCSPTVSNTNVVYGQATPISTHNQRNTSETSPANSSLKVDDVCTRGISYLRLYEDTISEGIPYYLNNFLSVLKSVFTNDEECALFNEEDVDIVEKFLSLHRNAQKLYVRLFTRQHSWIQTSKIKYSDIDDNLEPVLQELRVNGFLECEEKLTCLKTIFKVMQVSHLKELCKSLNLKVAPQKVAMIDLILKHCKQQKSVFTGMDITGAVIQEAKKLLQGCWRLTDTARRIFVRILMLFSLTDTNDKHEDGPFQLATLLLVNMGQLVYPPYEILREAKIFRSRHDLVCYEQAYLLDCEITSSMASKDFKTADSLCSTAVEEFNRVLGDESLINHHSKLPTFLRKFTAGHLYVGCLEQRVELLQKLKRYHEAVKQLQSLLRQNMYYQCHRGQWTERITLNLHQHMDNPLEALRVISLALKEPLMTDDHLLALHQRALRISKSKKLRLQSKGCKKALILKEPALQEIPEILIEGKKIEKSIPGYKTVFAATEFSESGNNFDVTLCSVEEFAILHYKHEGFPEGLHGEGSTLVSMFGLLFWDIIFCEGIADAFRSKHQRVPLDVFTSGFYSNRRVEIDARIDLVKCSPLEDLIEKMSDVWKKHFGQSSIVNWNLYKSFLKLQSLVTCIGNEFLAKVCLRFATNYSFYRGGIPDIIVWNPENGKWKMVEVKGPGDHLSNKQILWLDFLLKNEVDAEVCFVKAISGQKNAEFTEEVL